jgi:hypothetical protein
MNVVLNEEKNDDTVRALQEAQKDHKDLASRFKSMNMQGIVRGSLRIAPGRKAR